MSKSQSEMAPKPGLVNGKPPAAPNKGVIGMRPLIMTFGVLISGLTILALAMAYSQGHNSLTGILTVILMMEMLGLALLGRRAAPPGPVSEAVGLLKDTSTSGVAEATEGDLEAGIYSPEAMANQVRILDILYDAAASVTVLQDLDKLLDKYLVTLMELSGARAGLVRLLDDREQMRLVAYRGFTQEFAREQRLVPPGQCLSGEEITGRLLLKTDLPREELVAALGSEDVGRLSALAIPIVYHELRLGVYNLLLENDAVAERTELCHLFANIGRHLGLAIEKARMENHARRLSIMEERTLLANELHDSLAQSLASLRFQVSMAQETVEQSRDRTGLNQLRMIKEGLDQANSQLRELLAHFRTRMDERGLVPAIELMIDKFQKQTGLHVYFQDELNRSDLLPAMEVQVLHIVQEALTNIRKHADAQYVRVLLRSDLAGRFTVLVEDDGQGIGEKAIKSDPGENIGITIMKERASRIGGELQIESEAGEGTRVELKFDLNSAVPTAPLRTTS